jgi:hypothetical protein
VLQLDDLALRYALSKGIAPKKEQKLSEGIYPIDATVTLRIQGAVSKSKDTECSPTSSIPWKLVMAFMLEKAGLQRDLIESVITEAITAKVNGEYDDEENEDDTTLEGGTNIIKDNMKQIDTMLERVTKMIKGLPKKPRAGQTRVMVTITEIPTPQA